MSRRNIGDVTVPGRAYQVDRACPNFEALEACRGRDQRRSNGLLNAARRFPEKLNVLRENRLARTLAASATGALVAATLASSVFMRGVRIRVAGAIWRLVDTEAGCTTCTIIGRQWEVAPEALEYFDPRAALRSFRAGLNRTGVATSRGWLFAAWHGEYDPVANVFRLHLHCVCSAAMIPVIDRLRTVANYKSTTSPLPDGSWDPVYRRIRVNRQELYNLPDPLTYLLQSFWPSRPIFVTEEGRRRRVRQRRAIPEPYASMVLAWLDRWSLQDVTLLVGLRVTRDGLVRTRSAYTNSGMKMLAQGP